ncbi:hypothetical protein B0T16DRAFT_440666 [Cercophora newfieldiana]|uniref:Uncharacterized protein n=1 Tax=Cercophora newfieldiana TaxID=92897 RepID=A0AA39YMU4_9PEZI|nr:hypothetical protein B0T16DRAFT_440666 [Cercophora newfieldiana]
MVRSNTPFTPAPVGITIIDHTKPARAGTETMTDTPVVTTQVISYVSYAAAAMAKPKSVPIKRAASQPQTSKKSAGSRPWCNYKFEPSLKQSFRWFTDADGFKTKIPTVSYDGGKTWVDRDSEWV